MGIDKEHTCEWVDQIGFVAREEKMAVASGASGGRTGVMLVSKL